MTLRLVFIILLFLYSLSNQFCYCSVKLFLLCRIFIKIRSLQNIFIFVSVRIKGFLASLVLTSFLKFLIKRTMLSNKLLNNSKINKLKNEKTRGNSLPLVFFILHFPLKFQEHLASRKFQTTLTSYFLDEFLHQVLVIHTFL